MVDVCQWRAAIGLWNCCRLRLTSPNSSGLSPNCSSSGANSNDGTVEDNDLTARKNGGSYFCVRFCLDFCALRFAPEALCKCLLRSLVSRKTLSCMIYYLLFFLFLLLLSGDVELNPGPITVEEARASIVKSLQSRLDDLSNATEHCISDVSTKLFSKGLISEAVNKSPTFLKIFDEFKAGIRLVSDISQLVERYECFLECLSSEGGPLLSVVIILEENWRDIKKQALRRTSANVSGHPYYCKSIQESYRLRGYTRRDALCIGRVDEVHMPGEETRSECVMPTHIDERRKLILTAENFKQYILIPNIKVKIAPILLIIGGLPNSKKTTALNRLMKNGGFSSTLAINKKDSIGFCDALAAQNPIESKILISSLAQRIGYSSVMYAGLESIIRSTSQKLVDVAILPQLSTIFTNSDLNKHLRTVLIELYKKRLEVTPQDPWYQSYTCGLALVNIWDLGLNKVSTYLLPHLAGHLYNSHIWLFLDLLRDIDRLYEVPDIPDKSHNDKELIMRWHSRIRYLLHFAKIAKRNDPKKVCSIIASLTEPKKPAELEKKVENLKEVMSKVSEQLQLQHLIDGDLIHIFEAYGDQDVTFLYNLFETMIKGQLAQPKEVPLSFVFLRGMFYTEDQLYIKKEKLQKIANELKLSEKQFEEFCKVFTSFGSIIDLSCSTKPSSFEYVILKPTTFLNMFDKLFYYSGGDALVTQYGLVSNKTAEEIFKKDAPVFMSFLLALQMATKVSPNQVNIHFEGGYYVPNVCTSPPLLQCSPASLHLVHDMNISLSDFKVSFTTEYLRSYSTAQLDASLPPHINVTRFCSNSGPSFDLVYLGDIIEFQFPNHHEELHQVCEHIVEICHTIMEESTVKYNFAIMCLKSMTKTVCKLQTDRHALPFTSCMHKCSDSILKEDAANIDVFNSVLKEHPVHPSRILNGEPFAPEDCFDIATNLAKQLTKKGAQIVYSKLAKKEDTTDTVDWKAFMRIIMDWDTDKKREFISLLLSIAAELPDQLDCKKLKMIAEGHIKGSYN